MADTTDAGSEHQTPQRLKPLRNDKQLVIANGYESQRSQPQFQTLLQFLLGIDHSLRARNRFESSLHFKIELETPISGGMTSGRRIGIQPAPYSFFRADTLQNSPRLVQGIGCCQHVLDLIAPRERSAV